MYDYANILFTGKCNLNCFECIGKNPLLKGLPVNTSVFPLVNIDKLIEEVNKCNIPDLAFTGTNVDPQLYNFERELMGYLRERIRGRTKLSLHTNGLRALDKLDVFNSYDKASISFASFNPESYYKITGSRKMPDIEKIIRCSKVPLKFSMIITPFNKNEIPEYLNKVGDLGVKRVVIRKLKGYDSQYPIENWEPFAGKAPIREIFGWPVYDIKGVETTICGFDSSFARGLFLFSDGRLEDKLV